MPWSRKFDDPVPTPKGELKTLRDAGNYIAGLPKSEQAKPHWQAAAEAVMLVAERGGDTMLARTGMLQALNFGKPRPEVERSKKARAYRVIR